MMDKGKPRIVAVAGPNGSGKSTCAPALLRDTLGVMEFINADLIARGLSGCPFKADTGGRSHGK